MKYVVPYCLQRELNAGSPCIIAMDGNVTTITNPENGDKKTFAFDHSYWSCDGFKEDSHGVSIADGNKPYADQVGTLKTKKYVTFKKIMFNKKICYSV